METQTNYNKRILYLDILRAIAIISITFNHAVNRSFAIYSGQFLEFQDIPLYLTIIKVVLYAFSRIGVPLFVMITGALLLSRDYSEDEGSISRFIKHNWLQLFITTEIWLAIMFWYMQLSPQSILFTRGLLHTIARFGLTLLFLNPITMGSMWYMEMILCVYLLIPVIAIAIKKIRFKYFLIPMIIVIFCSYILPDINGIIGAIGLDFSFETKLTSANVFSMYVVYLLFGYYISKGALAQVPAKILWFVLMAAFVGFCVFQTWFYSVEYNFVVAEGDRSIFPMVIAVVLFELVRRYKTGKNEVLEKLAIKLSIISFGIYFVHICIMQGLNTLIGHFGPNIVLLQKFILLESVSLFGSIIIIYLCCKNKLMKKYLFHIK